MLHESPDSKPGVHAPHKTADEESDFEENRNPPVDETDDGPSTAPGDIGE